jgi:hypothetical protein
MFWGRYMHRYLIRQEEITTTKSQRRKERVYLRKARQMKIRMSLCSLSGDRSRAAGIVRSPQ